MKNLVLFMTVLLLACGCEKRASDLNAIAVETVVAPIDYGNGVYYIPATEAQFGKSLSHFIGTNTNKEIVSIAGDGSGGYGYDRGYFVVTREKN